MSHGLSPYAPLFHPRSRETSPQRNTRRSIITVPNPPNDLSQAIQADHAQVHPHPPHHNRQNDQLQNDEAEISAAADHNESNQHEPDVNVIQPPSSPPMHRDHVFPATAVRHRTTNIGLDNPEAEFQKTALDSCRSTIIQQQSEIKRLSESLDIRNKRIMQLESQIGIAASYMSSRDSNTAKTQVNTDSAKTYPNNNVNNDSFALISSKLSELVEKVNKTQQGIVIYNTSCTPNKSSTTCVNKCTQTDTDASAKTENMNNPAQVEDVEIVMEYEATKGPDLLCTICNKTLETAAALRDHIESSHNTDCDFCTAKVSSVQQLQEHITEKHGTSFLQCPKCIFRTQLRSQLNEHLRTCHKELSASAGGSQGL